MGEAIADSYADGKITVMDVSHFIGVFSKIGPALEGISDIPEELSDLEDHEVADIMAYCSEEFDIEDDELEEKIEAAFKIGLNIAKFIGTYI
jgi:hypothetical protein